MLPADFRRQDFYLKKHAKYFQRFLGLLPSEIEKQESSRGTIVFFTVCGLDVLNSLSLISDKLSDEIIDWIYSTQVIPDSKEQRTGGFMGTTTLNVKSTDPLTLKNLAKYKYGHLAMTYTCLATLVTLGDDLSRVDKDAVIRGVEAAQNENGSFNLSASGEGNEHDMRFTYCAASICSILNDWGKVDRKKMKSYILNSLRYDSGFSQDMEGEGHGGTTFCAVAALQLSGQLDSLSAKQLDDLKRWLLFRQIDGFQGRPNKPVDTCYSFWIGATLKILNAFNLTNFSENREYILSTQDYIAGGLSKWSLCTPDPFHTYLGICALSFINEPELGEVMPSLNISMRAYRKLKELHEKWKQSGTN